jgi:hypothetical protein
MLNIQHILFRCKDCEPSHYLCETAFTVHKICSPGHTNVEKWVDHGWQSVRQTGPSEANMITLQVTYTFFVKHDFICIHIYIHIYILYPNVYIVCFHLYSIHTTLCVSRPQLGGLRCPLRQQGSMISSTEVFSRRTPRNRGNATPLGHYN